MFSMCLKWTHFLFQMQFIIPTLLLQFFVSIPFKMCWNDTKESPLLSRIKRDFNQSCQRRFVLVLTNFFWLTKTFLIFFVRVFPESLRWLLATQQYCRSKWIMGHIAKKNRVNMELDADNILTGNKIIRIKRLSFTFRYYYCFTYLWYFIFPSNHSLCLYMFATAPSSKPFLCC